MKRTRVEESQTVSPPPPLKKKIESNITGKAVANFFTRTSEKEPERLRWRTLHESLLVGKYETKSTPETGDSLPAKRRKIAAFDFDSTLIKTSSGNVFGKSAEDWQWCYSVIPKRLRELHEEGYQVVIISNQAGISLSHGPKTSKTKSSLNEGGRLATFKTKVGYVLAQLDLPTTIYAATAKDGYRKPRTGMWSQLVEDYGFNQEDNVDLENSLFVGDAAGRLQGPGNLKADHSCSDRDFAANVGIKFYTPEELFLNETPRPFQRQFDPQAIPQAIDTGQDSGSAFKKKHELEIVLLCGSPGAGKSTFYARCLQPLGYERVNQDILKSRDRCLTVAAEHLQNRRSVAVDNTNADIDVRLHWIELARKYSVPIRVVHLTTPFAVCQHNDTVRAAYDSTNPTQLASTLRTTESFGKVAEELSKSFNPEHRSALPTMAFNGFKSRFILPKIEEGFEEVITVPFVFQGSDQARAIWGRYWV